MNQAKLNPLLFLALGICFAMIPVLLLNLFDTSQKQLDEAYKSYLAGEKAESIAERTDQFNHALSIYSRLENSYDPILGSGKLYYNIANSYFQLEQYPLAIFYYYRAQKLMPRSEKVKQNLSVALKKLNLQSTTSDSILSTLFFQEYFSLPERFQIFTCLGVATLILASLYIWLQKRWLIHLSILGGIAWGFLFLSICYTLFFTPLQGVIINPTLLYRDAGDQYAKVSKEPLSPGIKVEVIGTEHNGKWLKVLTSKGTLGYLSSKHIRLI